MCIRDRQIQLKGIPAILRVLQAENPSEKLEIALPPVSVRSVSYTHLTIYFEFLSFFLDYF